MVNVELLSKGLSYICSIELKRPSKGYPMPPVMDLRHTLRGWNLWESQRDILRYS